MRHTRRPIELVLLTIVGIAATGLTMGAECSVDLTDLLGGEPLGQWLDRAEGPAEDADREADRDGHRDDGDRPEDGGDRDEGGDHPEGDREGDSDREDDGGGDGDEGGASDEGETV